MRDEGLTVREAARRCGRSPETIRRWIWDGKLPARKLGNQLYIRETDLQRFAGLSPERGQPGMDRLLDEMRALNERVATRLGRKSSGVLEMLYEQRETHP